MSNRIRVLLQHPDHGPFMGGRALRLVEQKFDAVQIRRTNKFLQPALFNSWPRWKRCLWMTKKLGVNWRFQIFREPRGTNASKAAFWTVAEGMGFARPKRRKAKVEGAGGFRIVDGGRRQGRAQAQRANIPVDPRQFGPEGVPPAEPRRVRGLGEILAEMNAIPAWANPPADAVRGRRNQAVQAVQNVQDNPFDAFPQMQAPPVAEAEPIRWVWRDGVAVQVREEV